MRQNSCSSSSRSESKSSRRTFLGAGTAIAGATAFYSILPRLANTQEKDTKSFPAGKYVDCHVHIGTVPVGKTEPLTVDQLLAWMDKREISQAWVLPVVSPEAYPNPVSSEYVLEKTAPHRDRLIPFCAIDPRNSWFGKTSWIGRRQDLIDQLKRYIDQGARGFGEHKPGMAIEDPRNMEIYAGCEAVNLPVLFHLDALRNWDEAGLPNLSKVLESFPNLNFIGHSIGFWASISGEVKSRKDLGKYGKGPVMPGGALDILLAKHPNLYADASSGSGTSALKRDPEFTAGFIERWSDRLLFGTDYLEVGWDTGQHELFEGMNLSPEVQEKIYRSNARGLISHLG